MRASPIIVCALLGLTGPARAGDTYTIKPADNAAPKEIQEPIRKLLPERSVQLLDAKGSPICEVWLRKELPVKATPEQIKNGLTYHEMEESTVIGAIRFDQSSSDYRKQKIKPGVYTLRLGFQPMDGDHQGTAPYSEFCLLVPANIDSKPDTMEAKELREMSAKAIGGSHPGVLLLYPNEKPEMAPQIVDKGEDTWVLNTAAGVTVDGQKKEGILGLGLALIGHTSMM
jgi:hypothetical protein